jgi:hypothetical protein
VITVEELNDWEFIWDLNKKMKLLMDVFCNDVSNRDRSIDEYSERIK